MPMNNTGGLNTTKTLEKPESANAVDLELNVNKLHPEDLKRYAENLKKLCKYDNIWNI